MFQKQHRFHIPVDSDGFPSQGGIRRDCSPGHSYKRDATPHGLGERMGRERGHVFAPLGDTLGGRRPELRRPGFVKGSLLERKGNLNGPSQNTGFES